MKRGPDLAGHLPAAMPELGAAVPALAVSGVALTPAVNSAAAAAASTALFAFMGFVSFRTLQEVSLVAGVPGRDASERLPVTPH